MFHTAQFDNIFNNESKQLEKTQKYKQEGRYTSFHLKKN